VTRSSRFRCLAVLAVTCSLLLAGCGSKVSKSNYDKITTDMTEEQVKAVMGEPTEQQSQSAALPGMALSAKKLVWKDGNKAITVDILNGKVAAKASNGV
jgi:hypothetical protein